MLHRLTTAGLWLLASSLVAPAASAAELRITIRHALPHQGELMVVLFDRPDGFPHERTRTQPAQRLKPDGEMAVVVFSGLAEGRWAAMVLQDLNGNGRIDTNLVGLPTEPYGASNNKLPRLSAPRFEEALFPLTAQGAQITIELRRP
jgi:uncharacterized protein (DUF2141 family)